MTRRLCELEMIWRGRSRVAKRGLGRAQPRQRQPQGARCKAANRARDVPGLRVAGLIVALSTPLGCAAYISTVDVERVDGSAKRRVLI